MKKSIGFSFFFHSLLLALVCAGIHLKSRLNSGAKDKPSLQGLLNHMAHQKV
jgi:hypothetical protein